ncbi:hypothetical protein J2W24_006679 [Variovorax boronicumulans]|nr:hypothetical protein [Variovorax boronicumulans]
MGFWALKLPPLIAKWAYRYARLPVSPQIESAKPPSGAGVQFE